MERYCVGASMEIDWAEDEAQAKWDWCLAKRVFGYFRPYWRRGLGAIACLAAGAVIGLVPAVGDSAGEARLRQALVAPPMTVNTVGM